MVTQALTLLVENWLADRPGQTANQKTAAFAATRRAKPVELVAVVRKLIEKGPRCPFDRQPAGVSYRSGSSIPVKLRPILRTTIEA